MKILLLGGTAMLGREIATVAVERGHEVTCLARGSSPAPEGTVFIAADRDDEEGLKPVSSDAWDAVIDLSRQPSQVRRAVDQLDAQRWVFVSSGNVYADFSNIEQDESAAILSPLTTDVMEDMSTYGEAKVACEESVRGSGIAATIIRSGLIGGPGDWSGRSGYWPWRFAHPTGDDVIVPDDPDFPCALIDVRDLASWIVLATMNTERARAEGLVTRPLEDTLSAALEYENQRTEPRKAGLTDDEERRVRASIAGG